MWMAKSLSLIHILKFSPTRTQATYDFLTVSHDGTKGEVTVTLPLGKYTITEVQAPYGFVLTQQSYTVEFSWDNQKNDIVLAKTIVSHEQDGDKECSYSIVNVKDASDAHKIGQILVFEKDVYKRQMDYCGRISCM